ncbi:acid phosphatase/Vanadium-dependent haloperoxidase, partial [Glonium stellatum]
RPNFVQWLRFTVLDLITMMLIGVAAVVIFFQNPVTDRVFPIQFADGNVVYPSIAYPRVKEIITSWVSAVISFGVPVLFFIMTALIRTRSFWDLNNAILGLLYALTTGTLFQVTIKWLIGGFRPHFLATCKPLSPLNLIGMGYQGLMFDRSICTATNGQLREASTSFPSGHSMAAFAGFLFLSLYINAKFNVFANRHASHWKLALFYAPLLAATLVSASKVIDYYHHWYDVLAGAAIGILMALSAYRMVYASIW